MNGTPGAASVHLLEALREAAELRGLQAIHVLGHRSGTFYLDDGHITGVVSSGTPDIRTRLTRAGWADDGGGRTGVGAPGVLREDLRHRIEAGEVDADAVGEVVRSVILDAAWDLFRQAAVTPPRLRLEPGGLSPYGIDHRITVDDLEGSVTERLHRAEALTACPDQPVGLAPLHGSGVVLDDQEWSIVCHANGRLTPRDIAWANGAELFATVASAAHLVEAGLLAVVGPLSSVCVDAQVTPVVAAAPAVHAPARSTPPRSTPPLSAATVAAVAKATASMITAQRRPETPGTGLTVLAPPEWADDLAEASSDDPEVIQRLISGLRALG